MLNEYEQFKKSYYNLPISTRRENLKECIEKFFQSIYPLKILSTAEYADEYLYLSPEDSPMPGKFNHDGFEYLIGIEDACDDPRIREITAKKSGQTGVTTAAKNHIAKTIDQEPCGWLIVYPSEASAKRFSKRKLNPMIRDCPQLRLKVWDNEDKNSNSILEKSFAGGFISIVSAKSLASLSSQSPQKVLLDELNRFPFEAGNEGDAVTIIKKRIQSALGLDKSKIIKISTPTEKGASLISKEFESSDQRYYFVPCPICGQMQTLRFPNLQWEKSILLVNGIEPPIKGEKNTIYILEDSKNSWKWNDTTNDYDKYDYSHIRSNEENDPIHKHGKVFYPNTAYYECEKCAAKLNDKIHRRFMVKNGNWIAQNPVVTNHAGFFLNELYSPISSYEYITRQFLDSLGDAGKTKTFINLVLGEDHEDKITREVDSNKIMLRCEDYGPKLPEGVVLLTVGIDMHPNRLELSTIGWGLGQESWLIDDHVIPGDPHYDAIYKQVDLYLNRTYEHTYGADLMIVAACFDMQGVGEDEAGVGAMQKVLEFCQQRRPRNIFAIFGKGGPGIPVFNIKPSRSKDNRFEFYRIGTDSAKDMIYSRLAILDYGPGYTHFPKQIKIDKQTGNGEDLQSEYFEQLTAEKKLESGKWIKTRARNEALDKWVYAYAAFLSQRLNDEDLKSIADEIKNYQLDMFKGQHDELIIQKPNWVRKR